MRSSTEIGREGERGERFTLIRSRRAWRVVGWLIVIGVAAMAFRFWRNGLSWDRRFEAWAEATPMVVRLAPEGGKFEAAFVQTSSIVCKQVLRLESEGEAVDLADPRVAGMSGRYEIVDRTGRMVAGDSIRAAESRGIVGRMTPVPDGEYTFRCVMSAYGGDDAKQLTLVMRNELCGLERLPGLVSKAFGVGAAGAALTGTSVMLMFGRGPARTFNPHRTRRSSVPWS
jgi:hypothetical protein